jgi:hypothetical protein
LGDKLGKGDRSRYRSSAVLAQSIPLPHVCTSRGQITRLVQPGGQLLGFARIRGSSLDATTSNERVRIVGGPRNGQSQWVVKKIRYLRVHDSLTSNIGQMTVDQNKTKKDIFRTSHRNDPHAWRNGSRKEMGGSTRSRSAHTSQQRRTVEGTQLLRNQRNLDGGEKCEINPDLRVSSCSFEQ